MPCSRETSERTIFHLPYRSILARKLLLSAAAGATCPTKKEAPKVSFRGPLLKRKLENLASGDSHVGCLARYNELSAFPDEVKEVMGFAIHLAQIGEKHPDAKPLRSDPAFRGAGVLEIVDRHDGNAYRGVYTVNYGGVVYVLHAFQKKSKKGIATTLQDIRLIRERLKEARHHYEEHFAPKRKKA